MEFPIPCRDSKWFFRHPSGVIYDWIIEPALRPLKLQAMRLVRHYHLENIVDICCGSGNQCSYLAHFHVTGTDLNRNILRFAKRKYPQIPFFCADASRLPLKRHRLDGAILSFALHDKKPLQRRKMIEQVSYCLAPDGKLILIDFEPPWNSESQKAARTVTWVERFAGASHYRNGRHFLASGGLTEFIKNSGLIEIQRFDHVKTCSAVVLTQVRK